MLEKSQSIENTITKSLFLEKYMSNTFLTRVNLIIIMQSIYNNQNHKGGAMLASPSNKKSFLFDITRSIRVQYCNSGPTISHISSKTKKPKPFYIPITKGRFETCPKARHRSTDFPLSATNLVADASHKRPVDEHEADAVHGAAAVVEHLPRQRLLVRHRPA